MHIIELNAENVKRLRAVTIRPDGNVQIIAGKNGAGKTSVLDSIWYALAGASAQRGTVRPIRDGEDRAHVRLEIGDPGRTFIITRTWTSNGPGSVIIESPDGARYPSPQAMLDKLVGTLSFDPLAFATLDPKAQVAQLVELADLPFDPAELDRDRSIAYADRTALGRDRDRVRARLGILGAPPEDTPEQPVSAAELLAELEQAREAHKAVKRLDVAAVAAEKRFAELGDLVTTFEQQLATARAQHEEARAEAIAAQHAAAAAQSDPLPDLDAIRTRIQHVDLINDQVRIRQARDEVAAELAQLDTGYQSLTDEINALDETKRAGLAGARFPVDGLSFDNIGVTYQGIPFRQCSTAEQLRVSLAIAMALNPRLRVIRITDGSLLDSSNMALIEEMARDRDFQVWIERVDETGSVGVVIEDGAVAEPELAGATS